MIAKGALRFKRDDSNYKLLEMKLGQNKTILKNKLPDIEKALDMVKHLASKKVVLCLRIEIIASFSSLGKIEH